MSNWEDMEPWERLAAKLADAGPTEEHAREWVLEVLAAARADERERTQDRIRARTSDALSGLRARVEALPTWSRLAQDDLVQRADVLGLLDGPADD